MPLDVAIIGGGVGGLTLAVALQHNPNLRVNVYERAKEMKEIGAVVGVAPNGLRTLEKLGVDDVLTDHVGWRGVNGIPMTFMHYKTGEIMSQDFFIDVPDRHHHFARMHRAKLQRALLEKIPSEMIHLNKKAENVEADRKRGGKVTFTDGTTIKADIIIGADGIKSKVRQAFVPDHTLVWTGDVIIRGSYDYSLVEDIEDLPQDSSHFSSPTAWFFPTRIGSDGFALTASFVVDPATDKEFNEPVWNGPADVQTLRERFAGWHPTVDKVIDRIPWVRCYSNVAGRALDTWTFQDRVTLVGDAGHTHGGAFAAGVSLAIDDAYCLSLALDEIFPPSTALGVEDTSVDKIRQALDLYESTRRPHTAKVLEIVHANKDKSRKLVEKRLNGQAETDEEFRKRYAARPNPVWLNEHDVEAAFRKVVQEKKALENLRFVSLVNEKSIIAPVVTVTESGLQI